MPRPIELRSDNAAGVAPAVLDAVVAANQGSALAYGGDDWTAALHATVAEVFEHPDVAVFPVVSGTAANALGLATLCPPWGAVLCHETAHIYVNECGATSMFGGGAVFRPLPGTGSRLHPAAVAQALAATRWGDPHQSQPAVLSLTNPTDLGAVYSPEDVQALRDALGPHRIALHLDGARLANAVAALGCTPAEVTWRAGVDVLSLGAIKNGGFGSDAIVCFDPALREPLEFRLKRAGHIASKMRFPSASLVAYLADGLWLRLADHANAAMARLAGGLRGLGVPLVNDPQVNMAFVEVGDAWSSRLADAGLLFYGMGGGVIRLVTSWQTSDDEVDEVLARFAATA